MGHHFEQTAEAAAGPTTGGRRMAEKRKSRPPGESTCCITEFLKAIRLRHPLGQEGSRDSARIRQPHYGRLLLISKGSSIMSIPMVYMSHNKPSGNSSSWNPCIRNPK